MASYPFWTPDELAVLDRHIDEPDWLARCLAEIGRSAKALKIHRSRRRAELGRGDGRRSLVREQKLYGLTDDPDEMEVFNARTAVASQALLAAIERAGVRP